MKIRSSLLLLALGAAVSVAAIWLLLNLIRDSRDSAPTKNSASVRVNTIGSAFRDQPAIPTHTPSIISPVEQVVHVGPVEPDRPENVRAQRERLEQRLSQSGSATGEWVQKAPRTFDNGMTALRAVVPDVQLLRTDCYRDGCIASLRFDSLASQSKGAEELAFSEALRDWPGAKIISGPDVQENSTVRSDLILLNPTPKEEERK